jgi:hypothetical protein
MIAGLHSPRRKPQVNAMDQVFGTYRLAGRNPAQPQGGGLRADQLQAGLLMAMGA